VNPATGGEYWVTPAFIGITGGTGYVTVDGSKQNIRTSSTDGTSQSKLSPTGACISAAGQTQKIGNP
jgi:hypothetical protein